MSEAKCPVCGQPAHEPIPTEADSFMAGIPLQVCPNLPERCVWIDGKFHSGPPGAVFLLEASLVQEEEEDG